MPICSNCKNEKNESDFSWRNKQKCIRQSKCKECVKKYAAHHYDGNKQAYKLRARRDSKKEKERTKSLLNTLKKQCALCDETWNGALDFHHLNADEKEHTIAKLRSRKKIIEESKKCVVLCANHHRKFHSGHIETIEAVKALVV